MTSCDKCGEKFQTPILARFSANGSVQTYYACPRCLTKISKATKENEETLPSKRRAEGMATKSGNVACQHYFGYLKKRPKKTPIPDECLECDKMLKCLLH